MRVDRFHRKTGVAMLVTLLVLLVVLIGVGTLGRWVAHGQKLDRVHRHQIQANWLAESGLERCMSQLDVDDQFVGDTWGVTADTMSRPGRVTTRVVHAAGMITIESVSLYPSDATIPRRAVRKIEILKKSE